MLAAPPPNSDTVPVPATVRDPVLVNVISPAALVDVITPLLVNVLLLTFIVMFRSEDTVTFAFTVVPAPVVFVVTAPPFRFRRAAAPAESAKVSVCPRVGVIPIVPAVVVIVPLL